MNVSDDCKRPVSLPKGEVVLLPRGEDGAPLSDPLSIFHRQPEDASVLEDGSILVGPNLVVDHGRQVLANLVGGRDYNPLAPSTDWQIKKISFGTYDEAPRFTDVGLSPQPTGDNEIELSSGVFKKPLLSIDFPAPFLVRFEGLIGLSEANGFLIREMALWPDNESSCFARKVIPGINKSNAFSISILWTVRF